MVPGGAEGWQGQPLRIKEFRPLSPLASLAECLPRTDAPPARLTLRGVSRNVQALRAAHPAPSAPLPVPPRHPFAGLRPQRSRRCSSVGLASLGRSTPWVRFGRRALRPAPNRVPTAFRLSGRAALSQHEGSEAQSPGRNGKMGPGICAKQTVMVIESRHSTID